MGPFRFYSSGRRRPMVRLDAGARAARDRALWPVARVLVWCAAVLWGVILLAVAWPVGGAVLAAAVLIGEANWRKRRASRVQGYTSK